MQNRIKILVMVGVLALVWLIPAGGVLAECKPGEICQEISEPIGGETEIKAKEGAEFLMTYAATIYRWMTGIIGFIAVLIIVVSGIQIITSGVTEQQTEAKARIMKAFSGLALLFLVALFLHTINPTFFTL